MGCSVEKPECSANTLKCVIMTLTWGVLHLTASVVRGDVEETEDNLGRREGGKNGLQRVGRNGSKIVHV